MVAAAVAAFGPCAMATPDEKDLDPSVRLPVRRLHPEREFDQQMKKMHQEHEAKEKEREEKARAKEEKERAKEEKRQAKEAAKKKGKHDDRVIPPRPQQQSSTVDKSLMKELLSKDYSIKKYDLYEEPKPITWKDDPVSRDIDGLKKHMASSRKGGATVFMPSGVSTANDANEVFFCFDGDGNKASSRLRLRVHYYADDPLNYTDIVFTIDGFEYKFHPNKPSRGKLGARMYWEQSEDVLTSGDKDLVYALSHCHWARMALRGSDGMNHVKMLTQAQLDSFARTLELYRAMGGGF